MSELNRKNENTATTDATELFMCNICNDCYSQKKSFKLHYRSHKSFPCEVCHQVFTLKRDLNVHLRTHDKSKQKYTCAECNAEFFSKNRVEKHMKCHEVKQYVCEICNAELSGDKLRGLRGHKILDKSQVCDDCQANFLKECELKGYASADATVQEFKPSDSTIIDYPKHSDVKYMCSICNEVLECEAVLKSHSDRHEKEKSCS